MTAIDRYPEPVTRLGLLLLAHTFLRTSELIGAQWSEIRDPETWVIPEERMKRRIPHVVPLSGRVRSVLEELRSIWPRAKIRAARSRTTRCCSRSIASGTRAG
jgi:integrase